ncbi:transposase family protein [Pontibacter beigongshangensis]|uniref:transposase family protein n=1 Tax=Pontibacter beigongshangensis TaxID=2574733 RepID=UPI00164F3307|nr:transposase family protein [Pontibacter beigongshangensis]
MFLSSTYPCGVHDKPIADQAGQLFPKHTVLVEDLGYLGYGTENVSILLISKKRSRNVELSKQEKLDNRHINHFRVPVEHVMAGVKRLNIAKEKIRIQAINARDKIMMVAGGLHHLRTVLEKALFSASLDFVEIRNVWWIISFLYLQ